MDFSAGFGLGLLEPVGVLLGVGFLLLIGIGGKEGGFGMQGSLIPGFGGGDEKIFTPPGRAPASIVGGILCCKPEVRIQMCVDYFGARWFVIIDKIKS